MYSFVENSANDQTIEETQLVAIYELGKISDCLYGRDFSDLLGYKSYAMGEVADFVSMCRMLCEQSNLQYCGTNNTELWKIYPTNELLNKMFVELAKAIRGLHHIKRYGSYNGDNPATAITKLRDYTEALCAVYRWNFEAIIALGEVRYEERMKDLRTRGINDRLKVQYRRKCPGEPCEGCAGEGVC